MVPIHTRKPKPTRADVTTQKNFQTLAENWLVSDALAMLNRRHLEGKVALDPGNSRHVRALVEWLDRVAGQEFEDTSQHPEAWPSKCRLSLDKIRDSNRRRALRVLQMWDPRRIEGRQRGGQHGAREGVRKGPARIWTHADLVEVWELPPRQRRAAALTGARMRAGRGMSSSTYYRLAPGMPEFLANLAARRAEDEARARELLADLFPECSSNLR